MSKRLFNKVYFKQSFVDFINSSLDPKFKEFWNIEYKEQTDGFVRTSNNEVVAFYFYINTNSNKQSILKFNFRNLIDVSDWRDDEFQFDSIYVNKDLKKKNNYQEYRYNEQNDLIASYNFGDDKAPFFCKQFKEDKHKKSYTHSFTPKLSNSSLTTFSKKYLTKDLSKIKVDYFHVKDNKNEIYWFIR